MELQIQDLVDSIKREGIEVAESEATKIVELARKEAADLVAAGTKEAALIVEKGKKESNLMVASGKAALEQAARDLILSLQKTIEGHFDRLLEESVNNSFSSDQLVALISDVVKANIAPTKESVVDLNPDTFKKLGNSLKEALAKELKEGLEIRPLEAVSSGFRLSLKDGSSYYDFSTNEISIMLKHFLNPTLQEIVTAKSQNK
ncbi:MAG: V-type ATP synthase subunit E [Sphaerochaetaceae bacterium]|jgi:V/A-type H+-transporting ATPase subunit E|nr:V-type ATP synthase subunit E [Sphaerochaetaceae bacterium]